MNSSKRSAPGLLTLFFFTFLFSSCNLINPDEDIPSYIRIDSVAVSTNSAQHGSNSHKIPDAWVYLDNQLVGAFELPATIPVVKEGTHELSIRAGIKNNGISATRNPYPFYNFYTTNINLEKTKTVTVNPVVTYFSGFVPFELIEGFESAGISLTDTLNSDTSIVLLTAPDPNVFEGNKTAAAYLDATNTRFMAMTASSFQMPSNGSPVYLELNYRCNQKFAVGVLGGTTDYREAIMLNPSTEWNKIYIDLSAVTSFSPVYNSYKLFIAMQKEDGIAAPELLFDNLKLIY